MRDPNLIIEKMTSEGYDDDFAERITIEFAKRLVSDTVDYTPSIIITPHGNAIIVGRTIADITHKLEKIAK
jgi:hypothetical protein